MLCTTEPPRSHFDSVTQRLTLNMDHFCPWVVNTVGFYNRKFFMLFLIYANFTMLFAVVFLLAQAPVMFDWLQSEDGAVAHWFPGILNLVVYGGAIAIDAVLVLCVLGPFTTFHLRMAAHNETTIEGSSNSHYDVGQHQNLRSVFGRNMWTWPLPLYLSGPDGDGLHWPSHSRTSRSSQYARQMSATVRPSYARNGSSEGVGDGATSVNGSSMQTQAPQLPEP